MRKFKHVGLVSGLVCGLMFLGSVNQPVMAGWLENILSKKGPTPEEVELEPEKYCLEYFKQRRLYAALRPCTLAAKRDASFYYYLAMAEFLNQSKNFELLFDYFKKAKQFLETQQDVESKQKLARVYYALGVIFDKHGKEAGIMATKDYRQVAIQYFEKALALAEETNENNIKAFAASRLLGYFTELKDLEKAEMYLQKAEKAFKETKETMEIPKEWIQEEEIMLYYNKGRFAYAKKDYAEAEKNFKKMLDIVRKCCYEDLPEYWNIVAVWLYKMGKYDEAEEYVKKAIQKVEWELKKLQPRRFQVKRYEFIKRLENLALWYENLAEIYIKKNDLAQAKESLLEANRKYKQLEGELQEGERESILMFGRLGVGSTAKDRLAIKRKIEANEKKLRELIEMTKQDNKQDK